MFLLDAQALSTQTPPRNLKEILVSGQQELDSVHGPRLDCYISLRLYSLPCPYSHPVGLWLF